MELQNPVTYESALFVAERMREWDHREIYATRWTEDPRVVAMDCAGAGSFSWCAGLEKPIAVIGAIPTWPGVWSVFMFATDDFRRISFSLTKFVKRVMIPALRQTGAHRAECCSIEGHEIAHRWLELLGAKQEGPTIEDYGRNRESFRRYVWR